MPKTLQGTILNGLVLISVTTTGGGANTTVTEIEVTNNGATTLTLDVYTLDGNHTTFRPPPGVTNYVLNPPLLASDYAGYRVSGA